ncbi:hypothetical protein PRIPAC_77014 [Pristionchus pacificus]|uniref:Cytochrome P450 n=1 Tax=Pristionchus pacificus TaxID=54126 RepID=A0A2A6CPT5_PRIPA|nr:hypothetical protein PRIPAC_77014 [Pristionchus pacificus]|eukprot:PDM80130.1 cytochrome P450 [Pristionchus pacificus]
MLAVLLIGALSLLVYAIIRYYTFTGRYPKGPLPLPFIGNLLEYEFKAPHKSLAKFGKENPPIYTVFTPIPFVQITDFALIREAFVDKGDDFAGRPTVKVLDDAIAFAPNAGVLSSSGDNWREQRRTSLMILKDFGMGRNLMEEQVRSSIANYIERLSNTADKDHVDVGWPIQVMVANIINETLFGYRYTHDNCQPLLRFVEDTKKFIATSVFRESPLQFFENLSDSKALFLGMMFPVLTKLPITKWHTSGRFKAAMGKINEYIVDNVDRTLKEYDVENEPTCFVHAYKQRMEHNEFLDQTNLYACCSDFFLAGTETTATTLKWAMLIFAAHQEAQEKLRCEIHAVVGKDRPVAMADQTSVSNRFVFFKCHEKYMNFFRCPKLELASSRFNDSPTFWGYKIPKDTWINADIHYLMANDPVFVNPEEFRPERYLMEDGKTLRKDLVERTIPFSIGKRACTGEGLARVEIFIGIASTLQHFKISPSPGMTADLIPETMRFPRQQTLKIESV